MIIPISEASVGYAQKVRASLRAAKLHVEVDASDKKMQKKVREAQLAQFNYILVSLLFEPDLYSSGQDYAQGGIREGHVGTEAQHLVYVCMYLCNTFPALGARCARGKPHPGY